MVASEADKLTEQVKRHRAGLASAVGELLKRPESLAPAERRTLLSVLRTSRLTIEKLETAINCTSGAMAKQ